MVENAADLPRGLVVGEVDAAAHEAVPFVPNRPKGVGERGTMLTDTPTGRGIVLNLNRLVRVRVEGAIEMHSSAADCNNGVVVKVFHKAKYTGNARICPV